MSQLLLEIAADGLESALAAQQGGADRVELCANLAAGGTTPSAGTIGAARDALDIPLFVLIRPRAGDFLYSLAECEAMVRDIETCARLGCDGVVIGALDPDGDVDMVTCRTLIRAAGSLEVTFHRAFDVAREHHAALERLVELGCSRVLTSGGCPSAPQGAGLIAQLVARAAGRIGVLAGAGIRVEQVSQLVRATGVREIHASAAGARHSAARYAGRALPGLERDWLQSDAGRVRELVAALRAAAMMSR